MIGVREDRLLTRGEEDGEAFGCFHRGFVHTDALCCRSGRLVNKVGFGGADLAPYHMNMAFL